MGNLLSVLLILVAGAILGFLIKGLLYLFKVSVSNWLIFLSSTIIVGYVWVSIAMSYH